jgi:hypothetical protein
MGKEKVFEVVEIRISRYCAGHIKIWKERSMKKKLALLLAFSLVLSLVPAGTLLAEEAEENGYEYEYTEGYENDAAEDEADAEDAEEAAEEEAVTDEAAEDEEAEEVVDGEEALTEEAEEEEVPIVPITEEITVLRFVIGETSFLRRTGDDEEVVQLDAAPYIDAAVGRTMVPLAAIAQGLGATVEWDEEARDVVINDDIRLNIDTDLPDGMGRPAIVESRTFVPLAFVADLLGASTIWVEEAQAIYVS